MSERDRLIDQFLHNAGWKHAIRIPLTGDASFRQYDRIKLKQNRAMLMDAPPSNEDVGPFVLITKHLRSLGYSAPEIFAQDLDNGLILLEDLGDSTFTQMLETGVKENIMYECAVDFLISLHRRPFHESVPPGVPSYDTKTLLKEVCLLTDWYLPQVLNADRIVIARESFLAIWSQILSLSFTSPETLVLRDFHADNLMWLPDRKGTAACGLIDYQDAVIGPPSYDLMSLLEDARRDVRPELFSNLWGRYLSAFPNINQKEFLQEFNVLAAQRHCKVIGIFTRLAVRDNKRAYLTHIPRIWGLLETVCNISSLKPLKDWFNEFVMPGRKKNRL